MLIYYYIHCFFQGFNYSFVLLFWGKNSNLGFMFFVLILQGHLFICCWLYFFIAHEVHLISWLDVAP